VTEGGLDTAFNYRDRPGAEPTGTTRAARMASTCTSTRRCGSNLQAAIGVLNRTAVACAIDLGNNATERPPGPNNSGLAWASG